MKKISTKQIGDGKIPNRFWLSISNDYYYCRRDPDDGSYSFEWIDNVTLYPVEGKTIKIFKTFQEALTAAQEICLGEKIDGIVVNCVTIEDRLSGEVYEKARHFYPEMGKILEEERTDISYSVKREAQLKHLSEHSGNLKVRF